MRYWKPKWDISKWDISKWDIEKWDIGKWDIVTKWDILKVRYLIGTAKWDIQSEIFLVQDIEVRYSK